MKHITSAILIAAVCGCSDETQVTQPRQAPAATASDVRYEVVKLPSLGGTQSRGMAINEQGWVAGWSRPGRRDPASHPVEGPIGHRCSARSAGPAAPCRGRG